MGELGMGSIASHHDELVLRLFGRLCNMSPTRLAHRVFTSRILQAQSGRAALSWCNSSKSVLQRYGLNDKWTTCALGDPDRWAADCRKRVNKRELQRWQTETAALPSLELYTTIKSTLRREQWLGIHFNLQARRLKLLARANTLDVRTYLASKLRLPEEQRPAFVRCRCCAADVPEDVVHFVMLCDRYATLRAGMHERLRSDLAAEGADGLSTWLADSAVPPRLRVSVLLGGRLEESPGVLRGARKLLDVALIIHRHVSNFLILAWRAREELVGLSVVRYTRYDKTYRLDRFARPVGQATERRAARGVEPHLGATALPAEDLELDSDSVNGFGHSHRSPAI